jgi:ABC-type xylose transport system permease subunit
MMSRESTAELPRPSLAARVYRGYEKVGFLPTMLVVLLIVLALFVPRFLAVQNIFNVLRTSSYLVIVSSGQMLVLIVGGFDLSVGALVALTSVVSASVMAGLKDTLPGQPGLIVLLGVLTGLGSGLAVGLVNGPCVAFLRVSAFIVTLGTMSIATGLALLLTNGIPVYGMPRGYIDSFARGLWASQAWPWARASTSRPGSSESTSFPGPSRNSSYSPANWRWRRPISRPASISLALLSNWTRSARTEFGVAEQAVGKAIGQNSAMLRTS